MSMYTQLLLAALERQPLGTSEDQRAAFDLLVRQRHELQRTLRPDEVSDELAVLLARQASYDVTLIRLATAIGIMTDPSRFDEPGRERARLEKALDGVGMSLDRVPGEGEQPEREP